MKNCSKCGRFLDLSMFDKNRNQCKDCRKEILRDNSKKYYNDNKIFLNEKHKIYNEDNKQDIQRYKKKYDATNKDENARYYAKWYQENLEKVKETQKSYQRARKKQDPVFKLRANISTIVSRALNSQSGSKQNSSILDYLPYSITELKDHIEKQFEPWMNWNNQGKFNLNTWDDNDSDTWTWQLDHIIPQSKLLYSSMSDENFQKCWALENLQPLSAKQNLLKGNKVIC